MIQVFANKYFLLISRLVIGFVFVYAGAEKIADPNAFAGSIINYQIFPIFLVKIITITIPWIEVTAGLLLILGITVKENAAIVSSLLVFFIILIIISMIRDLNIDCGCFGQESSQQIGWNKIIENTLLLVMGVILTVFGSDLLSITNTSKNV